MTTRLRGVYAAAVTPFDDSGALSVGQLAAELEYLKSRGCTGVLIGGSTGEAQSLSVEERNSLAIEAAKLWATEQMFLGTGAASIEDAIVLTKFAFDLNVAAVVVIPPFFFKNAPPEGLIEFYSTLVRRAVPSDGRVLLYNNPVLTSTEINVGLVRILVDKFPKQVVGIKDSSSNLENTKVLCKIFTEISVFVGDDRLVLESLQSGAAGAITGISGVYPELLVELFNAISDGEAAEGLQSRVAVTHQKFDGLPRIAAFKELLVAGKILNNSAVRPPLCRLNDAEIRELKDRFNYGQTLSQIGLSALTGTVD